jgi:sugar O-acyltransferase (sialic acid O-acetyltransferase NeuD family)
MNSFVLIGGGGHALVVAEAAALAGMPASGFLDDDPGAVLARGGDSNEGGGLPWAVPLLALDRIARAGGFIIALGDLTARRELIAATAAMNELAVRIFHPTAIISPAAAVGPGVFVGPGAIVHTRAHIAQHAIINTGAIIEHECDIGENVHIAPGAVLGGRARVGTDTLVGLGSRVLPGVRIGRGCTIGAGAVVRRDVPDGKRVAGVPARGLEERGGE